MTTSFPETKTGLRFGLASLAATACLAAILAGGLPVRAQDNPVLAKVNGVEVPPSFYGDTDRWHVTLGDSDQDR